jgi:lauroyl/myristoyl acyltransferase
VPSERRGEGPLLQLVYVAYVVGSRLAQALPERVAYAAAELLGALAARTSRKRAVVERNLARITGLMPGSTELHRLVERSFRSYARYWLETFRLARGTRELFLERFTCHHVERLDRARAQGKGAVVVVGHLGNWDAAGAWAGASGRPVATVAEVLRPRRLFEFFSRHRERLGITVFPAVSGVSAKLVEAARQGRLVAILGDRAIDGRGIEVEFFGAPATFPAGPASIALRAGVPVLVAGVYAVRLPDGRYGWEADVGEPLEAPEGRGPGVVGDMTERIARELERFIARAPEQWHVFQPFWLEDRAR